MLTLSDKPSMRSSVGVGPFRIYSDSYADKQAKRKASWERTERLQEQIAEMRVRRAAGLRPSFEDQLRGTAVVVGVVFMLFTVLLALAL